MNFHGLRERDPHRFPRFDVVAYHDHCTDGISAAAVVGLVFENRPTDMPEFIPVQYGTDLPDIIKQGGQRILFVDFCPEQEQLEEIRSKWEDFFVIDHHKSREWTREGQWWNHVFYSEEYSGAVLTWLWFHGSESPPPMLLYVQDRDLWQWKLTDSREVSAAIAEERKTVGRFMALLSEQPREYVTAGRTLLRSRTSAAKYLASKAFKVEHSQELTFYAVNATANVSEVCEEMLKRFPEIDVACAFFYIGPKEVNLSFRSRSHAPGPVTALEVAKEFGGGGHQHAAGAKLKSWAWNQHLENTAGVD